MKLNCDSTTTTAASTDRQHQTQPDESTDVTLKSHSTGDDINNNNNNNDSRYQSEQLIQFDSLIKTLIQKQNVQEFLNRLNPVQLKTLELLNLNQQQQKNQQDQKAKEISHSYESPLESEACRDPEQRESPRVENLNGNGNSSISPQDESAFDSLARIKIEYSLSKNSEASL